MPILNRFRHLAHSRPRLITTFTLGTAVMLALPASWLPLTRALTGWNVAVWTYLLVMAWLMMHCSHARVRTIAEQQDKSAPAVLAIMSFAAVISLTAIVLELASLKGLPLQQRLTHYVLTASTVIGSWLLVGTIFTFHYAHMFYRSSAEPAPLVFPDHEEHPDYWDFLYFSFTIAVAAQTSDVTVVSRSMRRVVVMHSILSFFFNALILGLSINIAATVIGS